MSLTYLMMYISSVLLVILYGSIGFSGAAPRSVSYDASPIYRKPRSTPETEVFSIKLNHLPEDRFVLRPLKRLIRAPAIVYTTGGPINAQDTTTTVQLPSSDPTSPISEIVSTSKEPKAPSSSERSGVNKRSADAQTSFFSPEKMRQTMVSMVSQRTANDAWSAASIDTSITSNDNGQELACNCTSGGEGILDPEDCDHSSGQCSCMSGYSGLQCEDCEDGHFTNGTSGCLPCSCDSFGAVNHLCDSSGMCLCKTGVYGPKCDDCHPGFFHFSSTGCQPCQCHNHTNYCHPQSGVCLNCMENTQGANCEECKPGFYRSSSATQEDPCSACPCSNTSSTGSCHTDAAGVPACDQCLPRYSGPRCEACAPGSFKVGGSCLPCECNGNEDPAGPAQLCDPASGRCLGCTNGTAGPQCQLCAPGFRGDARAHNCTRVPALRVLPTTENKTTTSPQPTSTAMAPPPAMPPADPTPTPTPSPTPTSNNNDTTTTAIGAPGATTPAAAPGENTTALTEVTWTQFNVVVLAVIILVVLLLLGFVGAVYAYREYQNRKLNAPFWTIELKEDNISFSSYHDSIPNADVSGLLEDEAGEAAPNGQLAFTTQGPCYKA